MQSWHALPNVSFKPTGVLTADFIARGISDFCTAGRYLQSLPYGRTTDRTDFGAVLREGRGTCSTKHALLAALAQEQGLAVTLTLGIYDMHERNTPGVGAIFSRYGLTSIPEAHCYLTYAGVRIDVTRSGTEPSEPIMHFLHEEAIVPEQIADYKVMLHRRFMQEWVNSHTELVQGKGLEEVWHIREACIAALSQ